MKDRKFLFPSGKDQDVELNERSTLKDVRSSYPCGEKHPSRSPDSHLTNRRWSAILGLVRLVRNARENMPKTSKKHGQEVGGRKTRSLKSGEPSWQIQTAKARFSEVFRRARTEGPQLITRQGKEGVVMISGEQY